MLARGRARKPAHIPPGVTIVDPVYVEDGVTLVDATIGPNVSIGAGSRIERSTLRDVIVGTGAVVTNATLAQSMIGDGAQVDGVRGSVNVSDHSVVKHAG
jgi:glucose-1-phosphate thymidylyltransferase